MRRLTWGLLTWGLFTLSSAILTQAAAHTRPPLRGVLITAKAAAPGRVQAQVMVWMQIPKSPKTKWLQAQHDLDRDGALSEGEGQMLGSALRQRILGSLQIQLGGRALQPSATDARGRLEPDGTLAVALLMTYEAPLAGQSAEISARLVGGIKGEPAATVEMAAVPPAQLVDASGQPRALWPRSTLKPGGSAYQVTVEVGAEGPGSQQPNPQQPNSQQPNSQQPSSPVSPSGGAD